VQSPQIQITRTGFAPVVIALAGEHDTSTRGELRVAVHHAIAAGHGVVVDLTDATFIDSSILRALVDGHRAAGATVGGGLAVVAAPASVPAQLFDLVRASEMLSIFPSCDAALASYPDGAHRNGRCVFPKCPAAGFVKENDLALCPAHRELLLGDPGEFRRLWGALDPRPTAARGHEPGRPESPLPPASDAGRI
jgi:anti-sigma B factor antagonist